ncbi:MAG: hypothetical protein MJY91_03945 [Bacteroidales bacterium]|nr:hypothetical protein [Candidatus Cryptobacteroides choladohippi]MCQ2179239.1 hypothetical protein [Bacteroidales bacterium]
MMKKYEAPELRYCNLDIESAFMTLSGLQIQVDEHISNGYDSVTLTGSEYMLDFDD